MDTHEIKSLIEEQGKAFEAYKDTLDELKKADTLSEEKLARIEKSLDDAVEGKAALEAKLDAERKEREELELRLSRKGSDAGRDDLAKEAKSFGAIVGKDYTADGMEAYKNGLNTYWRKGEKVLGADEFKAMSVGGDPDGGYFVNPDMSGRIVNKVYETSPIRQIASVQSITTDALEGIEDLNEAAFGWVGETDSRADTNTPEVGKWKIEAFELYAMPKATQKLLDDASVDIEGWLAGKIADKLARAENAAFVTGTGAAQPKGFASYTTAADDGSGVTWGTIGHVLSGASGAFNSTGKTALNTLFDLVGTVKDAYLPNSRWVTRRSVVTAMRKLKDDQGDLYWQPSLLVGQPETFMGYPITRAEDVPALAANSLSLWFGDFGAAYQVVDRQGIRVLRDPYTSKPYVKFYTTKRTGGGVLNFEAIKAMKFGTA